MERAESGVRLENNLVLDYYKVVAKNLGSKVKKGAIWGMPIVGDYWTHKKVKAKKLEEGVSRFKKNLLSFCEGASIAYRYGSWVPYLYLFGII